MKILFVLSFAFLFFLFCQISRRVRVIEDEIEKIYREASKTLSEDDETNF